MTSTHDTIQLVDRALGAVRWLCLAIASTALVVLVATFGWLVFGRYVLNVTPTWVEQLALLLICYIVFLGAGAGVRDDTHIGVTLFRDLLPRTAQKVLVILVDLVLAAFGAIMLSAGITLTIFGLDTRLPMLDIPESVRTLAITSCGGLVFLFAGLRAVMRIARFGTFDPAPPATEV